MLLIGLLSTPLCAQVNSGSILGTISNAANQTLPGARVSATNSATRVRTETTGDDEGRYSIGGLPPGEYEVQAEHDGSRLSVRLSLHTDEQFRLDMTLGGGGNNIVVRGTISSLQTQSAETGAVFEANQAQDLPLLGRKLTDLALLAPGVVPGAGGNVDNYSVNGQREFSNSIVVNGIEVTGNRNNDTNVRPSVDAIEEVHILTSTYAPEFGRSAGGVLDIQTRFGSNQFHGSGFGYFQTPGANARTFFAAQPSNLKDDHFGATLGGPIRRNSTFFFASYEGDTQSNRFSYLDTTVPLSMIKILPGGDVDLSGLRDPYTGKQIPIFDPAFYNQNYYSQQFTGNVIPAARVSKAGLAVLKNLFPAPNAPGILNGWFNNYQASQSYSFTSHAGDLRLDHSFNPRTRASFTYDVYRFSSVTGDPFAGAIPIAGGGGADSADQTDTSNHSLMGSLTRVVTTSQLNELRLGFLYTPLDQNTLLHGSLADQLGIRNVNLPGFPATQGLPQIFLGFGALAGGSTYKPLTFRDENFSLADVHTWNRGTHTVKFGYEYRHLTANPHFSLFPTGFQYYNSAYSSLTSDPGYSFYDPNAYYGNGGNEIADLLLGLPGYILQGLQLVTPRTTSFENHLFFQDSWRVSSKLTIDYGVRYEYQAPYSESDNHTANFSLATSQMLLAGVGSNSDALVRSDKNNFAPRFGAAWRVTPKWVVRSGYGIYYTPENSARSELLTENYPFYSQQFIFNNIGSAPSYILDTGIPRPTSISIPQGASQVAVPPDSGQKVFYVDPGFRTGYAQMFNFTVQHELFRSVTVEAGYVGALAHKLPYEVANLNLANRLSNQAGVVQSLFSEGNSAYHSLQVKAEKRFSSSYGFLVAYTFAKSLDNGPAPFDLAHNHNQEAPQSALDLADERGPASTDVRHNLTFTHDWKLPFGGTNRFLGGWEFHGITSLRSGLPVNVVRNGQNNGYEGLRPNVLGDPNLDSSQRTLARYFDTSAFSAKGLGAQQPGNAGRGIVRGPGYINLDLSIFKDIAVRETTTLQIRVNAFNIANTPHFANPNSDLSQGQFGSITQTIGNARILEFAVKLKF